MRIDIITLFPEMFEPVFGDSIIGRARQSGAVEIHTHQLRDYAFDKHRRASARTLSICRLRAKRSVRGG